MSGYWNVITKVAQQPAVKKVISKVVDYAVKKTPRKFKVAKTIKSQPPHTGTLKKTRAVFEDLAGAASKGRSLHGKEWTTETLMKGSKGQKLHDLVTKTGKIEQKIKKLSN